MQLYVLDAHLENFVRIGQLEIPMVVEWEGEERTLVFLPQAIRATGEEVGSTSMFSAEVDFLPADPEFEGRIPLIEIGSQRFTEVEFSYPEGHEIHEH